jgi:hypothetical protein
MEQLLASLQKWFDPHMLGELLLNWTGNVQATFAARRLRIPYPRMRLEQRPQGAE